MTALERSHRERNLMGAASPTSPSLEELSQVYAAPEPSDRARSARRKCRRLLRPPARNGCFTRPSRFEQSIRIVSGCCISGSFRPDSKETSMTTDNSPRPMKNGSKVGGSPEFHRHWEPVGHQGLAGLFHGSTHTAASTSAPPKSSRKRIRRSRSICGRGKSEGERFYVDSIDDYVSDLSQTIEAARSRHPDLPVYLLGHSAGGVTACSYALDYQDRIAGLICESFAFRVYAPDIALKLLEGASHVLRPACAQADNEISPATLSGSPNQFDPLIENGSAGAAVAALARPTSGRAEFDRSPPVRPHGTAESARPTGASLLRHRRSADRELNSTRPFRPPNDLGRDGD